MCHLRIADTNVALAFSTILSARNGLDLESRCRSYCLRTISPLPFSERSPGHPAQYIDTDLGHVLVKQCARCHRGQNPPATNADPNDKSTMNIRDNFTGFWNLWKYGSRQARLFSARRDSPESNQVC